MGTSLTHTANRLLRHAGIRVIRAAQPSQLMRHLRKATERYTVDGVIDVGANAGQFAAQLRNAGFPQPIVSFEPASAPYRKLAEAAANDSNWRPQQLALGASSASVTLNVASYSLISSLHEPNERYRQFFGELGRTRVEHVQQRRLDEAIQPLLPPNEFPRLLLKIDTQGHDLEVLAGADGLLHRVTILVMELSFKSIYEESPTFAESVDELRSLGFELSGVFPVMEDDALTLYEADGVFVRPSLIADKGLVGSSQWAERCRDRMGTRLARNGRGPS